MTIATVKTVSERFIQDPKPQVLAIKGAWGAGKTYAWNKIVLDNTKSAGLKHYSYVSLFGISSVSQLAATVFAKARPIELVGKKMDFESINKHWGSLVKDWGKSIATLGQKIEVPFAKNLTMGLEQLAPHLIKETIVCLDDFERSSGITAQEVLGFISLLKEEKDCKVVLIFNQDKLEEKGAVYSRFREKVIDIELLFAPSPQEAVDLALPTELPCRDVIEQCCLNLKIANIRLLKKIVDLAELIFPSIKPFHSAVAQQAGTTLVLLAWSYYEPDETKPDLSFIRSWNRMVWSMSKDEKKQADPKEDQWSNVLRDYGLLHIDEFDLAIAKVIEHGYIEETFLIEEATKLDAQFKAQDLEKSFTQAWGLFHNSFTDNTDALIEALQEGFHKSYRNISPINLNGTVRLMREFGRDEIADSIVDFYIANRPDEQALFDIENYPFSDDITDTTLISKFNIAFTVGKEPPPLLDTVLSIAKKHGWSEDQIRVVEKASVDDFYKLFKDNQGEDLYKVIRACLQFETISGHSHLSKNPRMALERIGNESKINAIRVKRFGVNVETLATGTAEEAISHKPV